MINKVSVPLLVLLTLLSNAAYSGFKLLPGYYIENNGDTIQCAVQFSDWTTNPQVILVNVKNETLTINTTNAKGFGIYGHGDYRTASVTYHYGYLGGLNMPDEYSEKVVRRTAFLKVLDNNYYSLFELVTDERTYYFITENNGEPSELVYRVRQKNMKVEEDAKFRYTLADLFAKEGISAQYMNAISKTVYKKRELLPLIRTINEKHSGVRYKKDHKASQLRLDILAGVIRNAIPGKFNGMYAPGNNFRPHTTFTGGLNLMLPIPGRFNRFAVGLSANYNRYASSVTKTDSVYSSTGPNHYSTTTYTEKISVASSVIMTNLYAMYFINPLSTYKFYLKSGFTTNFSLSASHNINTQYVADSYGVRNGTIPTSSHVESQKVLIPLRGMYLNLNVSGGIKSNRHKVELAYYTPSVLNDKSSIKFETLAVYYYFTVFE